MYLLDTDTVIYSLKGETAVKKNLRDHFHDPLKMSVITLMELYYGAHKSQKITSNLAKIKTLELSFEIIPISEESAEIFGMTKAQLEKAGESIARVSHETSSRDCEDERATGQPQGLESEAYFNKYVAGFEARGRPEGRLYSRSQQGIREICGLSDFDLIIASCALTNNLVLVTNNVRHFQRIEGLKLTNWTEYPPKQP